MEGEDEVSVGYSRSAATATQQLHRRRPPPLFTAFARARHAAASVDKSEQLLAAQKFHPRRYSLKSTAIFILLSSRRRRVPPPRRRNSSQPLHLSLISRARKSTSLSRTSLTRSCRLSSPESATGRIPATAARHGRQGHLDVARLPWNISHPLSSCSGLLMIPRCSPTPSFDL